MAGKINTLIKGCTLTQTTTSTSVASSSSSTILFVTLNSQIRAGMQVSYTSSPAGLLVSSVVEEFVGNDRRTKVTLNTAQSISNSVEITFTATDAVFTNTGRYKDTSTFKLTITREEEMILSPAPSIDFSNVNSPNDYFVAVTDTESSNNLITRVYTITHTVPLRTSTDDDVITVLCEASQDKTAGTTKIYGYDLIEKLPGTNWSQATNQAVSDRNNLKTNTFSSLRKINKRKDNRLLIVYGDPGATLTVAAVSNTVTGTTQGSTSGNTVTVASNQSANILVGSLVTGTGITAGDTVVDVNTSTHVVTLSSARTVGSGVTLSFISSLIASATKTIGTTGIYSEEVSFPKNTTAEDLTYTFTLTEIGTDTFVDIDSPLTFTVKSSATAIPTSVVSLQPKRTKIETESQPTVTFYANRNEAAAAPGVGAE
jgi:hypothetical protein|tara:strand:+ start:4067 stop:5350 length:1284 start_codon:yes stop_codon:yes gene_type:complete